MVRERLAAAPEIEAGGLELAGAAAQIWDLEGPAGAELLGTTLAVWECEQGFPLVSRDYHPVIDPVFSVP